MRALKGGPIRIGDATTGGGTVVGGGNHTTDLDRPIATRVSSAVCCGRPQKWVEWCQSTDTDGQGWIIAGCRLTCGHTAVASDPTFVIEDVVGGGDPALVDTKVMAAVETASARDDGPYAGRYRMLKTDDWPFEGYGCRILSRGKLLMDGKTNAEGETGWVNTGQAEPITAEKTVMREDQRITEDWEAAVAALDAADTGPPARADEFPEEYLAQFETDLEGEDA
ncbi:hypothetical protein [Luteimonas salinilitoris]|uniref:PAAR domain-containing protein n=1 Tax=Luteimonas salinilitoris TaxID=3237697 RepID=A0ABV4HT86_9GAMM